MIGVLGNDGGHGEVACVLDAVTGAWREMVKFESGKASDAMTSWAA